ncbi:MAG: hypothetical protein ACJ786_12465 [Catenulispora sp.]
MAEATELVERLVAGRKVTVVKPTEGEVVAWRKVVDFAKRHGLVPKGSASRSSPPGRRTWRSRW